MGRKGLFELRVRFEGIRITDEKFSDSKRLEEEFEKIKLKFK